MKVTFVAHSRVSIDQQDHSGQRLDTQGDAESGRRADHFQRAAVLAATGKRQCVCITRDNNARGEDA